MRDPRIESLMVIGYNPSHSNINSEVNAPFKILSTLLRFVDNEAAGQYPDGEGGAFGNYQMARRREGGTNNQRLDTMEGYNDLYDEEEEESGSERQELMNDSQEESDEEFSENRVKRSKLDTSQEKIEVNFDEIDDDNDQECLLNYKQNELNLKGSTVPKKGSSSNLLDFDQASPQNNLFKIKESQDKGLADMETGSEVYMSELLVSTTHFLYFLI